MFHNYYHPECRAAAYAYAEMTKLWGEDFTFLHMMDEREDGPWLIEHHPQAAARLGWTAPGASG
jgi:hypothetical protein